MSPAPIALFAALVLAVVHVAAGHLLRLRGAPRSWVLSAGSGVSVAYVFVHLLPEVAELQDRLAEGAVDVAGDLPTAAWMVAMTGLLVFYGLELAARRSRRTTEAQSVRGDATSASTKVAWVHVAGFTLYNGVIGYLLTERAHDGTTSLALFAVAMAVHFLVNDHGLREHAEDFYDRIGRWVIAAGVLGGWLVGAVTTLEDVVVEMLIAFLGGSTIMHVLKEELPENRESRWAPLVAGAAAYGALLLAA